MISQQKIKENVVLFSSISSDEASQICSIVLDSIQYNTNIATQLETLSFSDTSTKQALADSLLSFTMRLLQSKSASSDCVPALLGLGFSEELAEPIGAVISGRLGSIVREMTEKSTGDKLTDLEWRFGLTATSDSNTSVPFIQMRLQFENAETVSLEMGMKEFYEFAGDIKKIQSQMSSSFQ